MISFFFFFLIFKNDLFILERERERQRERETEHEQERGRVRGRHRIQSKLRALSCQRRAWSRTRTREPNHKKREIMTWAKVKVRRSTTQAPHLSCIFMKHFILSSSERQFHVHHLNLSGDKWEALSCITWYNISSCYCSNYMSEELNVP